MIFLQAITVIVCGGLNALGGYHWLFCRRYILPFVFGVVVSIISHTWWLGFTCLPCMGTLSIGYFKTSAHWVERGLWLGLQALVIGLGSVIFGHLAWYFYLGYIVGALGLGFIYSNWEQIIGDVISGCFLGSIIFFVR